MNILKLFVNRLYCAVLSFDQLGSAIIFGRPDHTVSGEVGYSATLNKSWALRAEKVLDGVFGEKHCYNAIEWDRAGKATCNNMELTRPAPAGFSLLKITG